MGHESCGGISAALTGRFHDAPAGEGGFIHRWMSQIDAPAKEIARIHGTGSDAQQLLEEAAIRQSMANLRTFPFVADRKSGANWSFWGATFPFAAANSGMHEAEDTFRPVSTD